MKTLKNPWFLISVIVAFLVYISPHLNIKLSDIVIFYLNDLLCMPIVLTLCLAFIRRLYEYHNFLLSKKMIIAMTAFYALLFEGFLPHFTQRYTSDFIDVILYFSGAFFFYLIQPKLKSD